MEEEKIKIELTVSHALSLWTILETQEDILVKVPEGLLRTKFLECVKAYKEAVVNSGITSEDIQQQNLILDAENILIGEHTKKDCSLPIQIGTRLLCHSSVEMDTGEIAHTRGRIYIVDGFNQEKTQFWVNDDDGKVHYWEINSGLKYTDYFSIDN